MSFFVLSDKQRTPGDGSRASRPAAPEAPRPTPEQLLQRDPTIRYQRDCVVYAADGKIGTLKQVVVDEEALEVESLVIELDGSRERLVVESDWVDRSVGHALFLTITRGGLEHLRGEAPQYNAKSFRRIKMKKLGKIIGGDPLPRRTILAWSKLLVEAPAPRPVSALIQRRVPVAAD